MKKHVLGTIMSFCILIGAQQIHAQTTLTVDNATSCEYELLIILSATASPCTGLQPSEKINTFIPTTGTTVSIPAGRTIQRLKVIGCCGSSSGNTVVSYNCSPASVTGNTECYADPVTVNMISNTLVEISI